MDEIVLKWVTVLSGILTVIVCVSVFFFPDIHERAVLAAEQQKEVGGGNLIATTANPKAVVEQSKDLNAQLKIALPEGISKADVEIENDYVTQTIYIKFAGGVDDYFEQYAIKGSSDHIASMAYYKDKEEGVIALQLDQVYELKNRFKKGSLYLDFIDPHDIYDKVIVVDAGHGSHAAGAVKLGISEKSLNLAIVQQLKKLFDEDKRRIRVYYTRTSDTNPTLDQRVQLANKVNADLFISVHNNSDATGNFTKVKGTQVMYSESDDAKLSSKKLAEICLKNVVDTTGSENRGLLKGDSIYIIRTSEVPVALIEVGFMTNYKELDLLNSTSYQKRQLRVFITQSMKHFRRDIKLTEIIFATGNKDKMREIREIMADCDVHIVSMKEAASGWILWKMGTTFEENAKIQSTGGWLHIRMRLFWRMIPDWKSMH